MPAEPFACFQIFTSDQTTVAFSWLCSCSITSCQYAFITTAPKGSVEVLNLG